MNILHLTLKKKWYDMILSNIKKEEYREIKPYWIKRLLYDMRTEYPYDIETICDSIKGNYQCPDLTYRFQKFDTILFKNGYSRTAPQMLVELIEIKIGNAKSEWSDNAQGKFFVIKLGSIIEHSPF